MRRRVGAIRQRDRRRAAVAGVGVLDKAEEGPVEAGHALARGQSGAGAGVRLGGGLDGAEFARPPRPEGVVEEELDHVILGKELGDGREFGGADFKPRFLCFVDLLFALGLPELIGPAEGILGGEDGRGELGEEFAQAGLVGGRKGEVEDGVVGTEDAREDAGSEAAGEIEAVLGGEVGGEFLAFVEGDGDEAVFGVGVEEMVFGEEPGEEEAVPVFVGGVFGEAGDVLFGGMGVEDIAQGATAGAEAVAELALFEGHVGPVIGLMNGEVFEGGAAGAFGGDAGVNGGVGEGFAEVARKGGGGHRVVGLGRPYRAWCFWGGIPTAMPWATSEMPLRGGRMRHPESGMPL